MLSRLLCPYTIWLIKVSFDFISKVTDVNLQLHSDRLEFNTAQYWLDLDVWHSVNIRDRVTLLLVSHTIRVHLVEPLHLLHRVLRWHHPISTLHFGLTGLNKRIDIWEGGVWVWVRVRVGVWGECSLCVFSTALRGADTGTGTVTRTESRSHSADSNISLKSSKMINVYVLCDMIALCHFTQSKYGNQRVGLTP